jgi:molecular chaperone HtpG
MALDMQKRISHMTATAEQTAPQKMEFKTELKQLLDLIIHSLYTKKEIFLRELISNAADAIDKARFESLTNTAILEGNSDWKIKLTPDETAGTLTISDNGIGMSRETVVDNLGTIAKSGTRAFMDNLKKANAQDRPELIGQFGVGFYASFMVADKVTVLSRMAGDPTDGVKWESDGQGEFTVEPFEKPTRGTDVILHLREDAKDFLKSYQLRQIVKQYSDFIDHPVVTDVEKEKDGNQTIEEETLNSRKAIWLRSKSEIKPEEYEAFYKQIARDFEPPFKTIHVAAEGAMEFKALMFLPAHKPMDWMMGGPPKAGLDLYVKRVLIQHQCEELLPTYMRFVKGVVDSSDLPLNVSRETLQHNPVLARIKSNVVNRILKTLEETKTGEYDQYLKFYEEFSQLLKEGVGQDFSNRERLADLLLFESTKTEKDKFTTLEQYLTSMTADQTEIFYLIGESKGLIENSPYVESFKAKGQEVLLLTDPIDEYLMSHLSDYKGKKFKAADKGDLPAESSEEEKKKTEEYKPLLEAIKAKISEVKDVRLSHRLKESAAVLVADEYAPSAHLERLVKRMGQGSEAGAFKRTLELNPDHAIVKKLLDLQKADASDPKIEAYSRLLLDQATIAEGSPISDPAGFARRINALITG